MKSMVTLTSRDNASLHSSVRRQDLLLPQFVFLWMVWARLQVSCMLYDAWPVDALWHHRGSRVCYTRRTRPNALQPFDALYHAIQG
jgi:hypothetical protein